MNAVLEETITETKLAIFPPISENANQFIELKMDNFFEAYYSICQNPELAAEYYVSSNDKKAIKAFVDAQEIGLQEAILAADKYQFFADQKQDFLKRQQAINAMNRLIHLNSSYSLTA